MTAFAEDRNRDEPESRRRLSQFFHPIARSEEVTQSLNVFPLLNEDVLVFRTTTGDPVAFRDVCVHRGTRLSLGDLTPEGTLRCAYHGWEYNDTGRCVVIPSLAPGSAIPPKARALKYHAIEVFGVVWVALEKPIGAVMPGFPREVMESPDWRSNLVLNESWQASAGRVLENFCDWAHLPWVHENLLGTRDRSEVHPYDVWESDLQLGHTIESDEPLGPDDAMAEVQSRNKFVVDLPFCVTLERSDTATTKTTIVSMAVAPITPKLSKLYLWNTRNFTLDPERDAELGEFSRTVFAQDRRIVESQRPEEIPMSLREEMHLKIPDAFSLVYRRLLAEFGDEGDHFLKP